MTAPWWAGLAPVEFRRECNEVEHVVVWAEGELHVPDHPDADRERALVALGADPFPCLDLLNAWRRHTEDLDVLVLASRGASDVLQLDAGDDDDAAISNLANRGQFAPMAISMAPRSRAGTTGWTMYRPAIPGTDAQTAPDPLGVEDLLGLGHGLPERLVATVIGIWGERVTVGDDRAAKALPQLQAALYGRLLVAVRSWTGAHTYLNLVMAGPGESTPQLTRDGDHLDITVPFSWLRDVWVKGFAIVLGELCLTAERINEGEWRLLTASAGETTEFTQWCLTRSAITATS